jgi:hypothetical protein
MQERMKETHKLKEIKEGDRTDEHKEWKAKCPRVNCMPEGEEENLLQRK